jgi:uncharacterized membrane protein
MEVTAPWHPIIVHFAIVLVLAGIVFRFLSLAPRFAGLNAAAAGLLLAGTAAVLLANISGDAAHETVERIPNAGPAVREHEKWGEATRNVMVAVAVAEVLGIALRRGRWGRTLAYTSAGLCLAAAFVLFEAGEHGGDLVYSYAGGVGTRSGKPEDVRRLTLAAAFNQAELDRKEGRPQDAASIVAEAAKRFPSDPSVQIMLADSQLRDSKDPAAALATLQKLNVSAADARMQMRYGTALADAQQASGDVEAARATLKQLADQYPQNPRLRQKLDALPPIVE